MNIVALITIAHGGDIPYHVHAWQTFALFVFTVSWLWLVCFGNGPVKK